MATIIPIGTPVNDSEKQAIQYLGDNLPAKWKILHNFELGTNQKLEIDIAVLSNHAVYLVDVKGIRGKFTEKGNTWFQGEQEFGQSPLTKLRQNAKILSSTIMKKNKGINKLRKVHIHPTVLLTNKNTKVLDETGAKHKEVTNLSECKKYFNNKGHIPSHRLDNIYNFHKHFIKLIKGSANPGTKKLIYGNWKITEELNKSKRFTEYRAIRHETELSDVSSILRIYDVNQYQSDKETKTEDNVLSVAFRASRKMPSHSRIISVNEYFKTQSEDKHVLVFDDTPGESARNNLYDLIGNLLQSQIFQIAHDILSGLEHAHSHRVVFRNLSPQTILITDDFRARLSNLEFSKLDGNSNLTIAPQINSFLENDYQSPECFDEPSKASITGDIYSAGVIIFEMLTGKLPFENNEELFDCGGNFPHKPSSLNPIIPKGFDEWLQNMCEFESKKRFQSATEAQDELSNLIEDYNQIDSTNKSTKSKKLTDIFNLSNKTVLEDRFEIQKKLGQGNFSVSYKVYDNFSNSSKVIKLFKGEYQKNLDQMRQEYSILTKLPNYKYIIKTEGAGKILVDQSEKIPYILLEYIEGKTISDYLKTKKFTISETLSIAKQVIAGLAHLHLNGVYHLDIKPVNIIWTNSEIRIIDFNISSQKTHNQPIEEGTRNYLPPKYNNSNISTHEINVDRDLYAFGITIYECLTCQYPFAEDDRINKSKPIDPQTLDNMKNVNPDFANLLMKIISPKVTMRFNTAENIMNELKKLTN